MKAVSTVLTEEYNKLSKMDAKDVKPIDWIDVKNTLREKFEEKGWFDTGIDSQFDKFFELAATYINDGRYNSTGSKVTRTMGQLVLSEVIWVFTSDVDINDKLTIYKEFGVILNDICDRYSAELL